MVALLVLFALMLLPAQTALATHVQCGDAITADTTLDSDLIDCPGDGIVIAADGVLVDLNGHTLDGTGGGIGVSANRGQSRFLRDLEVRGGTVREFRYGVSVEDTSNVTVTRVRATRNADTGIRCVFSGGCQFIDNLVQGNDAGMGISIGEFSERPNLIEGNLVAHNSSGGLGFGFAGGDVRRNRIVDNGGNAIGFGAGGGLVEDNMIARNSGAGVYAFDQSSPSLVGNVITRNGSHGVDLQYTTDGAVLRGNTITRNALGGVYTDGTRGLVERNVVSRNGADGILIGEDGFGNVVTANRADRNGDLGIEAIPGTIDGGGNRAKHNGNPLQCVNITCGK